MCFLPFLLLVLYGHKINLKLLLSHIFVVICYPTSIIVNAKFNGNSTMFYII